MSSQNWAEAIYVSLTDGFQIQNDSGSESLIENIPWPNGRFRPGNVLHVRYAGIMSTAVSSPGTLSFPINILSNVGGVSLATLGPIDLSAATSLVNKQWSLDFWITVRRLIVDGSGHFYPALLVSGEFKINGGQLLYLLPASGNAEIATIDINSIMSSINVECQFSLADPNNKILAQQCHAESWN